MATKIPKPIIHIYKEVNRGKYKTTKHFELAELIDGTSLLSDKLNISKNRKYALSNPDYWLKIWQEKKWSKNITGLFKTNDRFVYWGDHNHRQNLIIFEFSDDASTLTAYYFQNYFTRDLSHVLHFIKEYTINKKRGQNPL